MATIGLGDLIASDGTVSLMRGFRLAHFEATDEVDPKETEEIPVVTVRSLEGITCDARLFEKRAFARIPSDRFRTREGDILIGLGSPYRVSIVDGAAVGALVTAAMAILRLDYGWHERIDPWYVAGYLNLPQIAQTLLSSKASGRNLTLADIESIELPDAAMEVQEALGEAARSLGRLQVERRKMGDIEMAHLVSVYAGLTGERGEGG